MTSLGALLLGLLGSGSIGLIIAKKFIIEPIREYRDIRKGISRDLVDYANLIAHPGSGDPQRIQQVEEAFRSNASDLKAAADDIPLYRLRSGLGIVPPKEKVNEAKQQLIGLSNFLNQGNVVWNDKTRKELKSIMGL